VLAYAAQGITGRNNKQEIGKLAFSCCPLFLLGLAFYGSKMVAEKEFFLKNVGWNFLDPRVTPLRRIPYKEKMKLR